MATQILVVDDDVELRDLLRDYLARQGIEVSVLHDAGTLERRLERERPDLIVLDLMMPGVDGLTALRKLRASGDDIPVIMLTARADDVDRIVGLELGADDYLGKPFNPRELLARVQAVCGAGAARAVQLRPLHAGFPVAHAASRRQAAHAVGERIRASEDFRQSPHAHAHP
jgi:DNA-binding response OmpR family regulator